MLSGNQSSTRSSSFGYSCFISVSGEMFATKKKKREHYEMVDVLKDTPQL